MSSRTKASTPRVPPDHLYTVRRGGKREVLTVKQHNALVGKFRDAMIYDPELMGAPLRVGLFIMQCYNMDGRSQLAYPGQRRIARALTISENTVSTAVKRLEERRWFLVERTKGGRRSYGPDYESNRYHPLWDRMEDPDIAAALKNKGRLLTAPGHGEPEPTAVDDWSIPPL